MCLRHHVPASVVDLCGCTVLVCLCGMIECPPPPLPTPMCLLVQLEAGSLGVQGVATHLPYDKEDERCAQHQGEHVAEGREGERHG